MNDATFIPLVGGCTCEKVRFRIDVEPIITHCCHCYQCQKFSGSAFRVNSMIEAEHVVVTKGTPKSFEGKDNQKVMQCRDCGTTLWSYHAKLGEVIVFVGMGVLDAEHRLQPEAHYFARSKQPWVVPPPGVPVFEEGGDPGKPTAGPRIMAALAKAGGGRSISDYTGEPAAS
ncbi:MAG: GFA family protein [Polyangiaceae bacterium]|nr:GFA family protein [Polyangiaceae bacterium]